MPALGTNSCGGRMLEAVKFDPILQVISVSVV